MAETATFLDRAAIYRRLVGARIRADWQFRTSFLLFTFAQCLTTVMDLLTVLVVFGHVTDLGGWSLDEVLFLSATSMLSFGLADVFVSPVERASSHIKAGTFDRFLLRPMGPLFQLCCDEFALRRAGRVVQPAVLLVIVGSRLGGGWTLVRAVAVAGIVVTGSVIYSALWVLTSSLAFWTVDTREVANAFTFGGGFIAQYPLDVLSSWLRRVTLLIPVAFVTYLPSTWLLGKRDALGLPGWAPLLAPAVAGGLCTAAAGAWRTGIRHYRSSGT